MSEAPEPPGEVLTPGGTTPDGPSVPEGFLIGHWSDPAGMTGCTVIIPPAASRGGVWVAGGGPGTRETDVLGPLAGADQASAILFTGGSAFGLAAADGVVRWLEEHGRGYPTPFANVPLVGSAVVYDLASGDPKARPGPDEGHLACEAARVGSPERGRVGAGTGAMVGKLFGRERGAPGGVGFAAVALGSGELVAALAVCNAFGDVLAEDGTVLAGASGEDGGPIESARALIEMEELARPPGPVENTTLVCICTDAVLSKTECTIVARAATAGMGRAVDPVFTALDGDVAFCLSSGTAEESPFAALQVGTAAATVTAAAIRDAVR